MTRPPVFLFSFCFKTKVEKTPAKCITEGEDWAQDYKMQTLAHLNSLGTRHSHAEKEGLVKLNTLWDMVRLEEIMPGIKKRIIGSSKNEE